MIQLILVSCPMLLIKYNTNIYSFDVHKISSVHSTESCGGPPGGGLACDYKIIIRNGDDTTILYAESLKKRDKVFREITDRMAKCL